MAIGLKYDKAGLAQDIAEIKAMSQRVQDLRPVFVGKMQKTHIKQMKSIFDKGGAGSRDGAWRALSPSTSRGRGILIKTGRLERSYTDPSDPNYQRTMGPLTLEIASTHPLAEIHEHGTRSIPKRRVQKSDEDHQKAEDTVFVYVISGVGGKGGGI